VLLVQQKIMTPFDFVASIVSGLGLALFFFLLIVLTKGKGMGFGDVKLAFPLGLIIGYPAIILATFLSFVIGAVVSLFLLALNKKKIKGSVPFGPFLIAGTVIALVWGEKILSWYMQYI
jgi:leader peptidase (prepilin peptidase)/N-methyltransferase